MISKEQLGILLTLFVATISTSIFDNSINEETLPVCQDLIKGASSRNIIRSPVPVSFKDLAGTWVSKSCETRPGFEYVTRSYWFSSEGKMLLKLRFYEDSSCRIQSHLIKAKGHLQLERKSYVTPGATEASYSFDRINIKTYSAKSSRRVVRKMPDLPSCHNEEILNKLKTGNEVLLYYTAWNMNQTSELMDICVEFLSWNELQLIRIEEDMPEKESTDSLKNCSRKQLFLGDFHTDIRYQKEYRPTAYQIPLTQDKCASDCNGCTTTENNISKLSRRPFPVMAYNPIGYWASVRCEVQRFGLFLTRILYFSPMKSSWNLKQKYYYDPNCLKPMYTILASGSVNEVNNTNIPKEIDMRIIRMSIIPDDKRLASQLNRLPRGLCGKPGKWNIGKRRDITITGGCTPIGLLVPSKEPEIYKININENSTRYLHLGQTPTWPRKRNRLVQRPTSWGPALRKCRKYSNPVEDNRISPIANARTAVENSAGNEIHFSLWLIIAMLIVCYRYQ